MLIEAYKFRKTRSRRWRLLITIHFFFLYLFFFPRCFSFDLASYFSTSFDEWAALIVERCYRPIHSPLSLSLPLAHIFALSSIRRFYCSKGGGDAISREGREKERREGFSRLHARLLTRSFLNRFQEAMHLLRNTACIPRTYLHFIYISINEFHSYDTKEEVENRN